ncbi:hypothetical protein F4821DRAFT_127632 [Hypoxylon rubiginosum]|uniref:Uncharacterized protein n=1 Tax=Hypoxylon rubiginosum TaxID=110542 RepID=A0ACC0D1M1_9PEZI|nr:hypothetical protein F4821DRAFT_127632 [Hypoxylon rubiginosum]
MASQDSSQEPSADVSISKCREHQRRICPPCLFNCQKVDLKLPTHAFLELEDGVQVYLTYPDQALFTWSEQRPDLKKLEIMADNTGKSRYDRYNLSENAGWYPQFIPQWDEQVVGAHLWDESRKWRFMEFKTPVTFQPDYFETVWCETCQLTWLKGGDNKGEFSFHSHPRHQALSTIEGRKRFLDFRSLIIYVDGALPKKTHHVADNFGIGVFFGKDSKHNLSKSVSKDGSSKHSAEFEATMRAMLVVRDNIIDEWFSRLVEADQTEGINHIRLIIATSSSNLVETFTQRIKKWTWDNEAQTYYKASAGQRRRDTDRVKDSAIIRSVWCQMELFKKAPEIGLDTVWYLVDKEHNTEALALAKASLEDPST